jgi:hypothetical protein
MPNLAQLFPDLEARDFEMGAKREPFEWFDVKIEPNVAAITREINILTLLASERSWEMPGWEDITAEMFVEYFEYLVQCRVASVWNDTFPGEGIYRQPSVGTRKALPMPATWLAYLTAIGTVVNKTENYGLRPVVVGAVRIQNDRQNRLPEMGDHDRVVQYLYTLEAKRVLPILRGLPRDMEGVSHVMHMQFVDDYFKTHQSDCTPNAAWVAGFLVRNRLERFTPFVKYFTEDQHLEQVGRIATREYRNLHRQSTPGGQPRQKPNRPTSEGSTSSNATPTGGNEAHHPDPESMASGPTTTQE